VQAEELLVILNTEKSVDYSYIVNILLDEELRKKVLGESNKDLENL